MLTQIQLYFDIVQAYFGTAVAILFIIQPVTIPLSSLFHALEVQARLRGWSRVQPVAYWLAKAFGTCAAIDLRNIQRVGGKFFTIAWEVLTKIIAAWPASKASQNKAVIDAMKDSSRILLALLALSSVLPLQGCAVFRSPTFWDVTKDTCILAMTVRQEVKEEAARRNLTGNEWASFVCGLSDVIEQYVVEEDTAKATERAIFFLRPKGLVK